MLPGRNLQGLLEGLSSTRIQLAASSGLAPTGGGPSILPYPWGGNSNHWHWLFPMEVYPQRRNSQCWVFPLRSPQGLLGVMGPILSEIDKEGQLTRNSSQWCLSGVLIDVRAAVASSDCLVL